ncbi:hypothetical protein NDU88_004426 [Pleurodeles waltl]|uniref:Uncharacterized protein n=1 Tax=Pleurodeles waltl TaxID=8319 RepID=A0AAV7VJX6_PLEWA|nr:hypothetical protein NDU88_004426 [Pleurodeles waltl]
MDGAGDHAQNKQPGSTLSPSGIAPALEPITVCPTVKWRRIAPPPPGSGVACHMCDFPKLVEPLPYRNHPNEELTKPSSGSTSHRRATILSSFRFFDMASPGLDLRDC